MVEAYKIILRESGSVRRAEELSRRMKAQSQQAPKPKARVASMRIVSEEIDRMQENLENSLKRENEEDQRTQVKLIRSRSQTKIMFVFKGGLEDTEDKLQKVYRSITGDQS
jgi:ribosome-binding ATPase YchF (GTP1/OBG family)